MIISINLSFETTCNLLLLLVGLLAFLIVVMIARTVIRGIYNQRMARIRLKYRPIATRQALNAAKTLFHTICKTAKNSVPDECLTEICRSIMGQQPVQDDKLSSLDLEILKELSTSLRKQG